MGLCLLALGATLPMWRGIDLSFLVLGARAFDDRPWQPVSTTFVHATMLHLLFNCYWIWKLGPELEIPLGWWRTLLIFVAVAAVSSGSEYAFFGSPVGLSGVVYGFWGCLFVLQRSDPRFAEALEPSTSKLLVFWFFLCIALSAANVLPIANFAHGFGALMGFGIGGSLALLGRYRIACAAATLGLTLLVAAGCLVTQPVIHLRPLERARQFDIAGIELSEAGHPERAVEYFASAVEWAPNVAKYWHNLGVGYRDAGRLREAQEMFDRSLELGFLPSSGARR